MKEMFLYTCGDSFSCIDSRYIKEIQWPILVQNGLGCEAIHLGRGASDNFYIYLQTLKALKDYRTTHLVTWWTMSTDRFMIRNPNYHEGPDDEVGAHNIKTHINEYELNYEYDQYKPTHFSDTYSNVIKSKPGDKCISRHRYPEMTNKHWDTLQDYWNYFHSFNKSEKEVELMKYYVRSECNKKGIQYIEINPGGMVKTKGNQEFHLINGGVLGPMTNHMNKSQHKKVSNYILSRINNPDMYD